MKKFIVFIFVVMFATSAFASNWLTGQSLQNGQQVTIASTTSQLTGDADGLKYISLRALPTNAGAIYIGGNSSTTPSNGFVVSSQDTTEVFVDQVGDIYISSDSAGDSISWYAIR